MQIGEDAISVSYTYDENGNIQTATDANGNTYALTHNVQGQVTSVTNPLGNIWTMQYDAAGSPKASTDPLGNTLRYTTDALGRITQATDALGNTLSYSYAFNNEDGIQGWRVTQSNELNESIIYQYDSVGNLLSTTMPTGDTVTYHYDERGRLQSQTDSAGNTVALAYGSQGSGIEGLIASALYPTYKENYVYNALGLPTQVIQVLSESNEQENLITRIGYDASGQVISMTDPAGRTTQTVHDAFGNIIKYVDAMGNETHQTWDISGNLTSVTDALGNTHRFSYDANGNMTQEITPLGQETVHVYNEANQRIQTTDPDGNVITYTYDAAGRLTQAAYTAQGQTRLERTISYGYNNAGDITEIYQTGADIITTRHVYTLDALGRKTQETITYGTGNNANNQAISQTIRYSYNADGQLASITYPGGYTQSYSYEHGQLKTVQLPNGQSMIWDGYTWQRAGQIILPGSTQILTYDALQRTQGIEVSNSSNTTLLNTQYTYDAAGNIVKRQTTEGLFTYAYDQLDRLTQTEPPQTLQQTGLSVEAYAYDAVGNRTGSAQQPGSWAYNADNQLVQFGSNEEETTYTYTANGNIATQTRNGQVLAYHYDAANRLVRITNETSNEIAGTEIVSYAYDAMGRRISKTVNGETTYYLYTDEGLIAELNDAGNITVAYGWQPDMMYGTAPLWQANLNSSGNLQTAQYHYITTDHLGTPVLATNQSGSVTWRAQAEAFGRTMPDSQNQITMNLRFPGQYYDAETQTHYNYYRDYNPQTGRYIQRDPIGLVGGVNTYAYAVNNPIYWMDSLGLLQRDADGNLIFNPTRSGTTGHGSFPDYRHSVMIGYLVTDNGQHVVAIREEQPFRRGVSRIPIGQVPGTNEIILSDERYLATGEDWSYTADCHGVTFADALYWINDDQVETILSGDGYRRVMGELQIGDIVVYRENGEPVHSVTVSGFSKNGNPLGYGKGGIQPESEIRRRPITPGGEGASWHNSEATVEYWRRFNSNR